MFLKLRKGNVALTISSWRSTTTGVIRILSQCQVPHKLHLLLFALLLWSLS